MSRLKPSEDERDPVARRLRREAPAAWRTPPARLRQRVIESLRHRPGASGSPPGASWRTFAWAAAWLVLVGVAAVLVARVVPRGARQAAQPARLGLRDIDLPVDRFDDLVAIYEAPLRHEARLIVADARTMHEALLRRVPNPARGAATEPGR